MDRDEILKLLDALRLGSAPRPGRIVWPEEGRDRPIPAPSPGPFGAKPLLVVIPEEVAFATAGPESGADRREPRRLRAVDAAIAGLAQPPRRR